MQRPAKVADGFQRSVSLEQLGIQMIDLKDRIAVDPIEIVEGEIRNAMLAGEIPFVNNVRWKECSFVRMATPAEVFAYRGRRASG